MNVNFERGSAIDHELDTDIDSNEGWFFEIMFCLQQMVNGEWNYETNRE